MINIDNQLICFVLLLLLFSGANTNMEILDEVCDLEIENSEHYADGLPFQLIWIDRINGEAIIEATKELSCEMRNRYKLSLIAIGCNGQRSKP